MKKQKAKVEAESIANEGKEANRMGKHYVFSARTTEEGLKRLNQIKASLDVSWDDLVVDALNVVYSNELKELGGEIPKVPKAEPKPKAEKPKAKKKGEKKAGKKGGKKGQKKVAKEVKEVEESKPTPEAVFESTAQEQAEAEALADPALEPEEVLAERLARAEVVA